MSLDFRLYNSIEKFDELSKQVDLLYLEKYQIEKEIEEIEYQKDQCVLADFNVTHNLNDMAKAAGIYDALWYPEENEYVKAKDIITILEKGLKDLKEKPIYYREFNPPNRWGTYEQFVFFVENVLDHCKKYPESYINVWK